MPCPDETHLMRETKEAASKGLYENVSGGEGRCPTTSVVVVSGVLVRLSSHLVSTYVFAVLC